MHVHWPAYNIYVHILKLIMEHRLKLELSGAHTPRASTASGLYPDLNLQFENVDDLYLHITLHCTIVCTCMSRKHMACS